MEHLSISDAPPPPPPPGAQHASGPGPLGRGAALQPQQPAQLPPQMFTTAAQLLDLTDKKLMVALRDGRKLIGVLRSWDQFANLVLQSTTERLFAPKPSSSEASESAPSGTSPANNNDSSSDGDNGFPQQGVYADIYHGIFLVRGENVLLLGEIDLDKDDEAPPGYEKADLEVVKKLAERRKAVDKVKEKERLRRLTALGFEGENLGDMAL